MEVAVDYIPRSHIFSIVTNLLSLCALMPVPQPTFRSFPVSIESPLSALLECFGPGIVNNRKDMVELREGSA